MKKVGVLLISLLIVSILALILVQAQDVPGMPEILNPEEAGETFEKGKETIEKLGETGYLKQEWKKFLLEKPVIGPIIKFIDKVLDPVSLVLMKKEVDFSWVYLLILAIWITLVFLTYGLMKQALDMGWIKSLLSGIIVASLALRAIPSGWFEFQVTLIWKAIIIGAILLIITSDKVLMDHIEKMVEKGKQQLRERKAAIVEKIHDIKIKANQ